MPATFSLTDFVLLDNGAFVDTFEILPDDLRRKVDDLGRELGLDPPTGAGDVVWFWERIVRDVVKRLPDRSQLTSISVDEGRFLVDFAVQCAAPDDPDIGDYVWSILDDVLTYVPESIDDAARIALAERGQMKPHLIYLNGGSAVGRALVEHASKSENPLACVPAIAAVGDATAVEWLRAQADAAPHREMFNTEIWSAGWELDSQGRRRDLCVRDSVSLVRDAENPAQGDYPFRSGRLSAVHCKECGHAMHSMFDIDLRCEAVAHLGLVGERLRICTCLPCGGFSVTKVDLEGRVKRQRHPKQPDEPNSYEFAPVGYRIGPRPKSPSAEESKLGGIPRWLNDPHFPSCPECERSMSFLGQLDMDELGAGSGTMYAFLCRDCLVAATTWDCT